MVKRKRYESRKTIKTQSRGHETRLREHCTPSTRSRREIRWLTTETPTRWTTELTIVSLLIEVGGLSGALRNGREERVGCAGGGKYSPLCNHPADHLYSHIQMGIEVQTHVPLLRSTVRGTDNEMAYLTNTAQKPTIERGGGGNCWGSNRRGPARL